MKNLLTKLLDNIQNVRNNLKEETDLSLQQLENLQKNLQDELNNQITKAYKKKDQLKELFKRKTELQKYYLSVWTQLLNIKLRNLISAPFIYAMIIPALILHIFLEIFQQTCFRLYRIPLVKMKDYFVFDRFHLSYLNWFEKINCLYCSYFNCLMSYAREIAGKTEAYWCPIKHAQHLKDEHAEYKNFVNYLDGENYRKRHLKQKQKIID